MQIELTEKELLVAAMARTAGERLTEYQVAHPEADENDRLFYAKLDTVRFFHSQLADAVLNLIANNEEPRDGQAVS